jgi:hypothetical protein
MGIGRKKVLIEVNYDELNNLIRQEYGQDFHCVSDMEWNNDESHSISLCKKELGEYDQRKVDQFKKNGDSYFILYALMQDMVNRDILEEGEYLINVCW